MLVLVTFFFFFFKQKTAYEMRISDWSSDVCSSDLWASGVTMRNERQRGHSGDPAHENDDPAHQQIMAGAGQRKNPAQQQRQIGQVIETEILVQIAAGE